MENVFRGYERTHGKPDKQFSILPTVLGIVGEGRDKKILDLGCGDGFFTRPLSQLGAERVVGVDNSPTQIALARSLENPANVEYVLGDIFADRLPAADIVVAPFVLNYAEDVGMLRHLIENIRHSLVPGGLFVGVVDLPSGRDLRAFGARKTIEGETRDGAPIAIELFSQDGASICTLHAVFFQPTTIAQLCKEVGFEEMIWHAPIVDPRGCLELGEDFWHGYVENSELGYFSVRASR